MPSGSWGLAVNWDLDVLIQQYEKALSYLGKTGDKYLIGIALSVLAYGTYSKSVTIEDPDKRKELLEKALVFSQDSERNLSVISYISPIYSFAIGDTHQIYFWELASLETDKNRKRDYLVKAIAEGTKAIALAEQAGLSVLCEWGESRSQQSVNVSCKDGNGIWREKGTFGKSLGAPNEGDWSSLKNLAATGLLGIWH